MSMAAAEESLRYTLFHWGFHPWATYAIVALTLAYFKFRHHAPAASTFLRDGFQVIFRSQITESYRKPLWP